MRELIEKIKKLSLPNTTSKDIEIVEKIIEQYLVKDPQNVDLWIRLALLELMIPLVDMYKSLDCLYKVLEFDPNNMQALLLIAHVKTTTLGGIDDDLFKQLCDTKTSNKEYQSLIEHAKADYYYTKKNMLMYEKSLIRSIEIYEFVRNCRYLSLFYQNNGELLKAKKFLEKAIINVKLIYYPDDTTLTDYTDVEEYFNEHLKGIHITEGTFESYLKYILEMSNLLK